MSEFFTVKEAAKILGVAVSTMTNWRHRKGGNSGPEWVLIDKRYHFTRKSLEDFQHQTDGMLNTKEAAKLACVEKRILAILRNAGRIPFLKIKGLFYYEQSDIEALRKKFKIECHGCTLFRHEAVSEGDVMNSVRCEKWRECRHEGDCSFAIPHDWPGFTADCIGFEPKEGYYGSE